MGSEEFLGKVLTTGKDCLRVYTRGRARVWVRGLVGMVEMDENCKKKCVKV